MFQKLNLAHLDKKLPAYYVTQIHYRVRLTPDEPTPHLHILFL
jgi:hypothetical protein